MLDCDDCHRWFHGFCVDVDSANPPETWYCDNCMVRRLMRKLKNPPVDSITLTPKKGIKTQDFLEDDDFMFDNDMDLTNDEDFLSLPEENSEKYDPVIKQLILNYLEKHSEYQPSNIYARQFLLSQWNFEDSDENLEFYSSKWESGKSDDGYFFF